MPKIRALKRIIDEIKKIGVPYYIHCGLGVFLQTGFHDASNLDDVDIRLQATTIDEDLYNHFNKLSDSSLVKLRGPIQLHGNYMCSNCLTVELQGVHFDIIGEMITNSPDLGIIEYPLKKSWFEQVDHIKYSNMVLPVLKAEPLLLYYLVSRRNSDTGKTDFTNIKVLASTKNFSEERFVKMLNDYFEPAKRDKLLELYHQYK